MPLRQILKDSIFTPAGMTSSYYDVSARNDGVYKNYLPLPGYNSYVSPLSLGLYNIDFPYVGNLSVSGDKPFSPGASKV